MAYIIYAGIVPIKVNKQDYQTLRRYNWHITWNGYAVRYGTKRIIFMHRIINSTPEGMQTDHINRDKLDNRRRNLRSVTNSENRLNTGLPSNNKSGYKGVRWHKVARKWIAGTKFNGKYIYLGLHKTPQEASKAYLTYTASR